MRAWIFTALACAAASCGGTGAPPESSGPAAAFDPVPAPGDAVVATVDGHPVYASCVAAQARRSASHDVRAALGECVDFELMAGAARARGLASDPDVALATRTALVSQLVGKVYEDGYTQPAQFGADWDPLTTKAAFRYRHQNYRASTYVRIPVAKDAPADADADAHATATRIADAVAGERGLLGGSFVALAQAAAGPVKLDHQDVPPYRAGALDDHYAEALFAIPEVGRTAGPVRTQWGWDVIAWTGDVPAASPSDAELAQLLLPDVKRRWFGRWVDGIARQLGVHVELIAANVDKLEGLP